MIIKQVLIRWSMKRRKWTSEVRRGDSRRRLSPVIKRIDGTAKSSTRGNKDKEVC